MARIDGNDNDNDNGNHNGMTGLAGWTGLNRGSVSRPTPSRNEPGVRGTAARDANRPESCFHIC